jgi:hypothetical protein
MQRTKFNKCLNLEPKIYNFSIVALITGSVAGIMGAALYGFVAFFALFGAGFWGGKIFGEAWWIGRIQRFIYWNFPSFICRSIMGLKSLPPSYIRTLL